MKNYTVQMPFAGVVSMEVKANDEEHAKQVFRDNMDRVRMIDHNELLKVDAQVDEWDLYDKLVSGNVLHVSRNEVDVMLSDWQDDEED